MTKPFPLLFARGLPLLVGMLLAGTGCIAETGAETPEEGPIAAASSDEVGVAQEPVTAPSCLHLSQKKQDGQSIAIVRNDCNDNVRFRMIWRWASDGACNTLWVGATTSESKSDKLRKDPYVTELRKC